MSYCIKCGAYIPMGETACPACGYDPEEERREQERKKQEEDEKRKQQQYQYQYKYGSSQGGSAGAYAYQGKPGAEKKNEGSGQQTGGQQYQYSYSDTRKQSGQGTGQYRRYQNTRGQQENAGQNWYDYSGNSSGQSQQSQQPLWESSGSRRNDAAGRGTTDSRIMALVSYLGPLFLIPVFAGKKADPFIKFHMNQGLNLFLLEALLSVVSNWFWGIGGLIGLAGSIFGIVCVIKGVIGACNGRMDKLPIIGDFRLIK